MDRFVLAIIATLITTYLFAQLKIYINIDYQRKSADDRLTVKIGLLPGRSLYTIEVPVIQLDQEGTDVWISSELDTPQEDVRTNIRREQRFLKNVVDIFLWQPRRWRKIKRTFNYYRKIYSQFMDKLLTKTNCEYFCWRTSCGSEDAAATGLMVGVVWAFKSALLSAMQKRLQSTVKPQLQVTPVFGRNSFEVSLRCIFSISLGNVINVAMSTFNFARKGAIGGG